MHFLAAFIATGLAISISPVVGTLTWGTTKNLFVFGDSYTTTGWNISAGVTLPDPGITTSHGPNWVMSLAERYNATNTSVYNLAYGGATIDNSAVASSVAVSIVKQVSLWKQYLSPPPPEVPWTPEDSLFAIWIGINDVNISWRWTNVTQSALHAILMDRLFAQVDILYQAGARSFVFLTVPPLERTPSAINQGASTALQLKNATSDYNSQLSSRIQNFINQHNTTCMPQNETLGFMKLFDTQKVFNTLLDNTDALGFVNATGSAWPYLNSKDTSQFAPISSYFWFDDMHPMFTVHDILAKALSTFLS